MADFSIGNAFPNTNTNIEAGNRTNSGLSTQIIIKVFQQPVGALQSLQVTQNRSLARISEVGTDGVIEIVPNKATEYELTATRIVFDQLRLPEAFSRNFRFIAAQRVPFDIDIIDISANNPNVPNDESNRTVMTYKNCWFSSYDTPYQADNYVITETSKLQCETAYMVDVGRSGPIGSALRPVPVETDAAGIEDVVNKGGRRGSLDAAGLTQSLFAT